MKPEKERERERQTFGSAPIKLTQTRADTDTNTDRHRHRHRHRRRHRHRHTDTHAHTVIAGGQWKRSRQMRRLQKGPESVAQAEQRGHPRQRQRHGGRHHSLLVRPRDEGGAPARQAAPKHSIAKQVSQRSEPTRWWANQSSPPLPSSNRGAKPPSQKRNFRASQVVTQEEGGEREREREI